MNAVERLTNSPLEAKCRFVLHYSKHALGTTYAFIMARVHH